MFTTYGYPYSPAAVSSAQSDASSAQASARAAMTETELLRHDVDRLLMLTEALWGFLKKEHGYTEAQLADAVKEIDLRDGRLDGKAAKVPPTACPQCQRLNSAKFSKCIYCGTALPVALFGG
jgi:hypothetical protein